MIEHIEWIGTLMQFLGVYLNAQRKRQCWWVWIIASGIMLGFAWSRGDWPVVGLFLGYEVLNVYGLVAWRQERPHIHTVRFLTLNNDRLQQEGKRLRHQRQRLIRLLGKAILGIRSLERMLPPQSTTRGRVLWFARHMEAKLDENRHKGDRTGWLSMTHHDRVLRLDEEVRELKIALAEYIEFGHPLDIRQVIHEAADVGNFAMFIADAVYEQAEAAARTRHADE